MTVKEIVKSYLEANGYDGLYDWAGDCGCELADLMPCCACEPRCQPGYKREPRGDLGEDTDAEWVIGPTP